MRLDVFGKLVEVTWQADKWQVFYIGAEGKKRIADDITIPLEIDEELVPQYLADLCHEWARAGNEEVTIIE